jgi:hypothetical protein
MELAQAYLANNVVTERLWITDKDNEVYQVKIESLSLKENPNYLHMYTGTIEMETWVWDEINQQADLWDRRIRCVVIEYADGNSTSYKILANHSHHPYEDNPDLIQYTFSCKKEVDHGTRS